MFYSLSQTIEEAIARADSNDWTGTLHLLQQLAGESLSYNCSLLTESEWEQTCQIALQVLEQGDFQQQWEIAKIVGQLGERVIPSLIALLENPRANLDSRWFAGRILSQFNHPDSILALAKLLQQTQEEDLALMASQSLGHLGSAAVGHLEKLLQAPESRLLAVLALAQIRRIETIAPLLQVIGDDLPAIRLAAIGAMGSFHDERVFPALLAALKDPVAAVRQEAIAALSRRSSAELPADLASEFALLLYDLNPAVCQEAALALGRLGTEEATSALSAAFKSPATAIALKQNIVLALSWLSSSSALDCLQAGLLDNDREICLEIIAALGRQESPDLKGIAVEILGDFLDSGGPIASQPQVKQLVATSLGELGLASAVAHLQLLAAHDEPGIRLHAITALQKIAH